MDMEEIYQLMKDLLTAIERNGNPDLIQTYKRIVLAIPGKTCEETSNFNVQHLLLEDIANLAKLSYLPEKSQRRILLVLYETLLTFIDNTES